MNNRKYKEKYHKAKKEYLELKKHLLDININMKGGALSDGTFKENGFLYKVYRTEDNNRFTFREVPFREIEKNRLTSNTRKPDKNKIMFIDDIETFDWFTLKYGMYDQWHMYISWDRVAKDYGGFYLNRNNDELKKHRYARARKGSEGKFRMESWWAAEYKRMPYDVMIFD